MNKFRGLKGSNKVGVDQIKNEVNWIKDVPPNCKRIKVVWGTTGTLIDIPKSMKVWENTPDGRVITEEIARFLSKNHSFIYQ